MDPMEKLIEVTQGIKGALASLEPHTHYEDDTPRYEAAEAALQEALAGSDTVIREHAEGRVTVTRSRPRTEEVEPEPDKGDSAIERIMRLLTESDKADSEAQELLRTLRHRWICGQPCG